MFLKYLLDTHTWIWWNMNPANLSDKIRQLIADSEKYSELLLSAISPWEFCKLLEKKKLGISCPPEEWLKEALDMPKFRLVELTPIIAYRSTTLPQPFHKDPGDQIIVATAQEENATLLTKDAKIQEYSYVKTLW
ncbi:type II toxin-antitoxin system VapC family toxin [Desulfobulbus sp. N3]|nr:type II toxin-antitoxin system VapC family toxin [Desulfobulbus sp. N3]